MWSFFTKFLHISTLRGGNVRYAAKLGQSRVPPPIFYFYASLKSADFLAHTVPLNKPKFLPQTVPLKQSDFYSSFNIFSSLQINRFFAQTVPLKQANIDSSFDNFSYLKSADFLPTLSL